jgi:tRNA-dihydrouridine synthase B
MFICPNTVPRLPRADPISIGRHAVHSRVFLAPMSGVTDVVFRDLAQMLGADLVVSEMVASEHLVTDRHSARRKAERGRSSPFVIQLAGCEARWMSEGARFAESLGADIIDINMGCPAREVTGKLSGSALMRDLDHALELIEAVIGAVSVPVTLKMRLGWDDGSRNAPELARRAEAAGIRLLTVHARTRCQFFKGAADWTLVRPVKDGVQIPVVVNGDIVDPATARAALVASGADAVMVGRGAYGAPWMPKRIADYLATGADPGDPAPSTQGTVAIGHFDLMLAQGDAQRALRTARKHIGWYLARSGRAPDEIKAWRQRLCTSENPNEVRSGLAAFYDQMQEAA